MTTEWDGDEANHPTIHCNRFGATKPKSTYDETHHVSEVSQLPKTTQFAVMYNETSTYDSGYKDHFNNPEYSTERNVKVIWFESEKALEEWVVKNESSYGKKTFQVIQLTPVKTQLKSVFTIEK